MTKISQTKQLRRDICRTTGHDWRAYKTEDWFGNECERCKKREVVARYVKVDTFPITTNPQVKYADINTRRFNILDRAQKRAKINLDDTKPSEEA